MDSWDKEILVLSTLTLFAKSDPLHAENYLQSFQL